MNRRHLALAVLALAVGGCASIPTGPSMMVLPGSTKSFDQFRFDDGSCRQFSYDQVAGRTPTLAQEEAGVRSAAIGTVLGALAGAAIDGSSGAAAGAGVGGGEGGRMNRYLVIFLGAVATVTFAFLVLVGLAQRHDVPDPVPQAMVLTGIVVAVAATALALALTRRLHALTGRLELPVEDVD